MVSLDFEKRQNPRIYFANEDVVGVEIRREQDKDILVGKVVNLSVGGLQFVFKRNSALSFTDGDKLMLHSLDDRIGLADLVGVGMEIRWVLDHVFFDHMAVGCEFIGLTEEQLSTLRLVVDLYMGKDEVGG